MKDVIVTIKNERVQRLLYGSSKNKQMSINETSLPLAK